MVGSALNDGFVLTPQFHCSRCCMCYVGHFDCG